MKRRWTIKELEKIDDFDFLFELCSDRQSDCSNINSPLYIKLAEVKVRLLIRMEEQRKKDKEAEEDTNNHIEILFHDISYYFDDDSKIELGDSESEHIEYMIGQGYCEGELNKTDKDGNDGIRGIRGYWSIVRK